MDTAYTYSARGTLERIAIYAPPEFLPPLSVTMTRDGVEVLFVRLSDVELLCGKVPGVDGACRTHECHRTVIGECQCGRHRGLLDNDPDDHRPRVQLRAVQAGED